MLKNIEISVIIATFNSELTVSSTLESVLSQEHSSFEVIVIDGDSKDSTINLLKEYEKKFIAKDVDYNWVSEKDSGIYDAWNKGLKLVQGNWVTFIGSDDCLSENALNDMSNMAEKHPETEFISARAKIVSKNKIVRKFGKPWKWGEFKKEMKVLHAGGWHNAEYFRRYGVFDSSYKITGDYEILLRAKSNLKTAFYKGFIIEMGAGGASEVNISNALKEACKAKVRTGGRPILIALLEMYLIYFKIIIRRVLR